MQKLQWFNLTESEAARLNHPLPREIAEDEDGYQWERYFDDAMWLSLGCAPRPRARWGWFLHHLAHGLMMHYPLHKVLGWSFWYSFIKPIEDGNVEQNPIAT